jgi:hypothetical protein
MNNRRERRKAAAMGRRLVSHGKAQAPRRTGYAHRLVAAIDRGGLARGVHQISCVHERGCGMQHGGLCDCVPNIAISGPDGSITVIDEAGNTGSAARLRASPP